ncbi:MAG: hypothetical protein HY314_03090 [Acidobacteria bacterium]|nr:hypothetical protein [Acidobacteriota bacterium]
MDRLAYCKFLTKFAIRQGEVKRSIGGLSGVHKPCAYDFQQGHLPHVVAVTAEPLPTRIAALALGTGDLDCVYHCALPELRQAIEEVDNKDQLDMLVTLIEGRRLRDISDLPFDLAT